MENFEDLGKVLLIVGLLVALVGLVLLFNDKVPLVRNLGRLPGDVTLKSEGFLFYFPLVTSLLLSSLLALVAWLLRR
jgi:hypothetical protein